MKILEDKIQLIPKDCGLIFKVHFENGKYLGVMIKDVDGYYYFEMDKVSGGLWNSYGLKLISKAIDLLNKDWNRKVKAALN